MRVRILIAAAIVTGGWLAACSKPTASRGESTASSGARQIRLAEPAVVDSAVVSDIEAGRARKVTAVAHHGPTRKGSPAALMAAAMPQMMGGMTRSEALSPRSLDLAAAPPAPTLPTPAPVVAAQSSAGTMTMSRAYQPPGGFIPSDGNYGPMVLIRGGTGGIDDKCDLRGGHRPGQAVNRSAPSFGGYPRGGIR